MFWPGLSEDLLLDRFAICFMEVQTGKSLSASFRLYGSGYLRPIHRLLYHIVIRYQSVRLANIMNNVNIFQEVEVFIFLSE